MLTRSDVEVAVNLLHGSERIAPADDLEGLALPTLPCHGDGDTIVPLQSSRDLAERLACAELHVLPGLGHVPIVTAPAQVSASIDACCQRVALAA
jgi:pimeloyl-ACP methyl ester carboxylesterase